MLKTKHLRLDLIHLTLIDLQQLDLYFDERPSQYGNQIWWFLDENEPEPYVPLQFTTPTITFVQQLYYLLSTLDSKHSTLQHELFIMQIYSSFPDC